jgi:hypothetical protein
MHLDVEKILAHLREELDLIEKVIADMENQARKGKRGRGRPPGWVTNSNQNEMVKAFSKPLNQPMRRKRINNFP